LLYKSLCHETTAYSFTAFALNLSTKFPCSLTKSTFCLSLGRPHRATLTHLWIWRLNSPIHQAYTARSEFNPAPGLCWNIPSVWPKLCQHAGLTDAACPAAQVTQLSLGKEECCRVAPPSSNRDSPLLPATPRATNLCCKTTTLVVK